MLESTSYSLNKLLTYFSTIYVIYLFGFVGVVAEEGASSKNAKLSFANRIHITKNADGQMKTVIVNTNEKVTQEMLDLLPKKDENKLSKIQIRKLAEDQRLFNDWEVNPVLQFQDGDISYWYEQSLPAWKLQLQFLARRAVLEVAEKEEATIPSQGDLSALSNPVFSWLYQVTSKKWNEAIPYDGTATKKVRLSFANFIHLTKNADGQVKTVIVDTNEKVTQEILDLIPKKDENKLSKIQIRKLAEDQRLFNDWRENPVLQFQDGDISYWYEQNLPAWKIQLQFLARRAVLEVAEKENATIPSQGDLSALSNPVFSWLYQVTSKKWKEEKK
jgi:hypothetical protein